MSSTKLLIMTRMSWILRGIYSQELGKIVGSCGFQLELFLLKKKIVEEDSCALESCLSLLVISTFKLKEI